jgi:hypothetical protein
MFAEDKIPEPVLFNPLKHHLGYIREFIEGAIEGEGKSDQKEIIKELKHLGTSVMDIYTGSLQVDEICNGILAILREKKLSERLNFMEWAGKKTKDFRIITLPDNSQWMIKYYDSSRRFVHIFPARSSSHTFRVKSNTLKSALMYYIFIGKDFITGEDLNKVRPLLGLSPIKDPADTEAITGMIEIIRDLP